MPDHETDPTQQVTTPKGRVDEPSATELTTGDFESVRPVTGTHETQEAIRPPEPLPQGAKGVAWLALLLILALTGAAAWFLLEVHMPMQDRLAAQAEQLRKGQKDATDLSASMASLKARVEQLEGELEELRVAADEERPAAAPAPAPAAEPPKAPTPAPPKKSRSKKKKARR